MGLAPHLRPSTVPAPAAAAPGLSALFCPLRWCCDDLHECRPGDGTLLGFRALGAVTTVSFLEAVALWVHGPRRRWHHTHFSNEFSCPPRHRYGRRRHQGQECKAVVTTNATSTTSFNLHELGKLGEELGEQSAKVAKGKGSPAGSWPVL